MLLLVFLPLPVRALRVGLIQALGASVTFDEFVNPMRGMPVSHAWRGHLSVIFFELGALTQGRTRKDGTAGNPVGEFTIHIEPNWRIEGRRSILCGSDDTTPAIERTLARTVGSTVEDISCVGRLPELNLQLSVGAFLTFSAWKGQPNWTINFWRSRVAMYSQYGKVKFDGAAPNNSFKPNPLRRFVEE